MAAPFPRIGMRVESGAARGQMWIRRRWSEKVNFGTSPTSGSPLPPTPPPELSSDCCHSFPNPAVTRLCLLLRRAIKVKPNRNVLLAAQFVVGDDVARGLFGTALFVAIGRAVGELVGVALG